MKIKKNGKVIKLTESDLKKIVKKVLVTEAATAVPSIGVMPEKTQLGYFNGKNFRPSSNITLEPGDKLKMVFLIPSTAAPKTPVRIHNGSISGGKFETFPQVTGTGGGTTGKQYDIKAPSFIYLRASFDNPADVIGKKLNMKVTGNFEGGQDISVPVTVPSNINVIQGSEKS
tara:strand:+ start:312 stop:827 length:516 start_codon:yes stop_codon:yes gene_type:complete